MLSSRRDTRGNHAVGTRTCESKDGAKRRHDEQESIWNAVLAGGDAIYFLTVFASLYFALYPLIRESYAYQEIGYASSHRRRWNKSYWGILPALGGRIAEIKGYMLEIQRGSCIWAFTIAFLTWYGSTH